MKAMCQTIQRIFVRNVRFEVEIMKTQEEIKEYRDTLRKLYDDNFKLGQSVDVKPQEIEMAVFNCRRYALQIKVLDWVLMCEKQEK